MIYPCRKSAGIFDGGTGMIRKRKVILLVIGVLLLAVMIAPFATSKSLVEFFFPGLGTGTEEGLYFRGYMETISYPLYFCIGIYMVKLWLYLYKSRSWDPEEKKRMTAETIILGIVLMMCAVFWFMYKKTNYMNYCCTIPMTALCAAALGSLVPRTKWYKVGHEYIR